MDYWSAYSNRDATVSRSAQSASAIVPGARRVGLRDRLNDVRALAQRWKGRIFYAFADQGLFSTTNFVLTVLYASWLPLEAFGRYVLVWTVSLFIEAIQNSMIIDPLPAIVSRYGRRNRQRIDAAAFWVVMAYGAVTSLLLVGLAAIASMWSPAYAWPLLVLAFVNPLQRTYLFFRRLCYIRDRQAVAATAAFAYGLASFTGAGALLLFQIVSVEAILALLGVGAAAAISVIVFSGIGQLIKVRLPYVAWLTSQIWSTGRWLAPAAVVSWLINWGVFPLAAVIGGAGAAGVIRALQNLLTPIVQFNSALSLAVLPRVADKVADHGAAYARRFAIRATAIFSSAVLAYCALILATAPVILPVIYRKPEIAASAFLLWPLSLTIICEAARVASSMSLLATRRTRVVLYARLTSLAAFAAAGLVLGYFSGYVGVLWANAAAAAAGTAVVIGAALRRNARK